MECVLNKAGLKQEISSVVFCVAFIFSCICPSPFWLGLIEHHSRRMKLGLSKWKKILRVFIHIQIRWGKG